MVACVDQGANMTTSTTKQEGKIMNTINKHKLDANGNSRRFTCFKCCEYAGRVLSRSVEIGQPLPKGYCKTEQEAIDDHKALKRAKQQEYLALKPEAEKQLDKHEEFITKYLRSNGVTLDYVMDGDTHGIHTDYMYISITIGRHTFTRNISY